MTAKGTKALKRPVKKGGKFFPALCNIIGTLILIAVIVTSLPLALPRIFGYEVYHVETGSMEPALPAGSIIYVEKTEPDTVLAGDIIAYNAGDAVITHRVVENRFVEGEFITKGDANPQEDFTRVQYADLVGRVKYHFPLLGRFMLIYARGVSKLYVLCLAACGVMFNMLAGRIRRTRDEEYRRELRRWKRRMAELERMETETQRER